MSFSYDTLDALVDGKFDIIQYVCKVAAGVASFHPSPPVHKVRTPSPIVYTTPLTV